MYKYHIRLDTMTDVNKFVQIAGKINPHAKVLVTDNNGLVANGRSLLGVLSAMEFEDIWCMSEEENIYTAFRDFIID